MTRRQRGSCDDGGVDELFDVFGWEGVKVVAGGNLLDEGI